MNAARSMSPSITSGVGRGVTQYRPAYVRFSYASRKQPATIARAASGSRPGGMSNASSRRNAAKPPSSAPRASRSVVSTSGRTARPAGVVDSASNISSTTPAGTGCPHTISGAIAAMEELEVPLEVPETMDVGVV